MVNENGLNDSERHIAGTLAGTRHETQQGPTIKLTKTRFILVLVGLALAIFLVSHSPPAAKVLQ